MKQPKRCQGVESGGCTVNEYWSDPPEVDEEERFDAEEHIDDLREWAREEGKP